jgi:hypothetical protein
MSGFKYTPTYEHNNFNKKRFFSVCIDDFFDDPDTIRKFALSLPMYSDPNGDWPGKRTLPLQDIDFEFWNTLFLKILSAYFDLKHEEIGWDNSAITFQQISSYSKVKDDPINVGWIHKDNSWDLAGLIYLTPNADKDCGTSLFNLNPEHESSHLHIRQGAKNIWTKDSKEINSKEYIKQLQENNNKFIEKTKFQNIYNRCIIYDANEFHRANNFYTGSDDRLTCVFFLNGIKVGDQGNRFPQNRVVDTQNFDDKLKWRIEQFK